MERYVDGDRLAGDLIDRINLIKEKYADRDWASQVISAFTEVIMIVRMMQLCDTNPPTRRSRGRSAGGGKE